MAVAYRIARDAAKERRWHADAGAHASGMGEHPGSLRPPRGATAKTHEMNAERPAAFVTFPTTDGRGLARAIAARAPWLDE